MPMPIAFYVADVAEPVLNALCGLTGHALARSSWAAGWWLALTGGVLAIAATRLTRRSPMLAWTSLAPAALLIVASLALSGHAAAATNRVLALAVDGLHVIGAGGWIGSLSMVLVAGIPAAAALPDDQGHAAVGALLNAFSPTALAFAGLLAATGAVAGWRNVGSVSALFGPAYGQVLVANSRRARWSSARAPTTGSESCQRSGQFMGRRACDGQRPSRSQRRWSS